MSNTPKKMRELYFAAFTFSSEIYAKLRYLLGGFFLIACTFYAVTSHSSLNLATAYPKTTFSIFFILAFFFYGILSNLTFNLFYQKNPSVPHFVRHFLYSQVKWFTGIIVLSTPAIAAVLISHLARMLSPHAPYVALALFFIAVVVIFFSVFYSPIYFIYFNTLLLAPGLSLKDSLRYANHLCFYNWWRVIISMTFFYSGFLLTYDALSRFYLHYLSKGPYFLTNLLFLAFLLCMLLPLAAAFNIHLINDLRLRNTITKNYACYKPCNTPRLKK